MSLPLSASDRPGHRVVALAARWSRCVATLLAGPAG